jgi:hypothetical protein
MFQFSAFPIAQGNCERIPIRRSLVLSLHAAPQGLSQLGTSFVGTRAEPFTSWHSSHAGIRHCDPVNGSSGRLNRTYTRRHPHARRFYGACINPSHPRLHGVVHRSFGFDRRSVSHLRDTVSIASGHGPTGIRTQGILLAKEALYR